jgi:hypothetical protein
MQLAASLTFATSAAGDAEPDHDLASALLTALRRPRPASERYALDARRRRALPARACPAGLVPVVTSFLAEQVDA